MGPEAVTVGDAERGFEGDAGEHGDRVAAAGNSAIGAAVAEFHDLGADGGEGHRSGVVGGAAHGLAICGERIAFLLGVRGVADGGEQQAIALPDGDRIARLAKEVGGLPVDIGRLGEPPVFKGKVQVRRRTGIQRHLGKEPTVRSLVQHDVSGFRHFRIARPPFHRGGAGSAGDQALVKAVVVPEAGLDPFGDAVAIRIGSAGSEDGHFIHGNAALHVGVVHKDFDLVALTRIQPRGEHGQGGLAVLRDSGGLVGNGQAIERDAEVVSLVEIASGA